jgi:hypothetical protein
MSQEHAHACMKCLQKGQRPLSQGGGCCPCVSIASVLSICAHSADVVSMFVLYDALQTQAAVYHPHSQQPSRCVMMLMPSATQLLHPCVGAIGNNHHFGSLPRQTRVVALGSCVAAFHDVTSGSCCPLVLQAPPSPLQSGSSCCGWHIPTTLLL